jgi:hypothetical protein
MTEQIKLCCDCKFHKKDWLGHLFRDPWDYCSHPKVTDNVVNGKRKVFCKTARTYRCDYEAKYWEERK